MGPGMTESTRRRISLAHLTVLDTTPPELVTVAAAAGFRTIGIRLTATPSVGIPPYDILSDGPLLRETLLRLADTGVSVLDTEFLRFEPEHPVGIPEGFLEVSARLGARNVLVMSAEPEEARTIERFGELCDRAAGTACTSVSSLRSTPGSGRSPRPPTSWPGREGRTRQSWWMPCTSVGREASPLTSRTSIHRCSGTPRSAMPPRTCPATRPGSSARPARAASFPARASCRWRSWWRSCPTPCPWPWRRPAGRPPISPPSSARGAHTRRSLPCYQRARRDDARLNGQARRP